MVMKIAVLFRGPIRPNPNAVMANSKLLVDQLKEAGHEVHSYLTTWTRHKDYHVSDLDLKFYDNVLALQEPSESYIRQSIIKSHYENLHATIPNVYKMYYQIKSTLETVIDADDYDRIVNSRTDVQVEFGEHMKSWIDPYAFVTPIPNRGGVLVDGICDWFNVAPPNIMYAAYNYGSKNDLSYLIDHAPTPEDILLHMLQTRKVELYQPLIGKLELDPNRYE